MTTKCSELPTLYGLILAGGKSSRMGKDKALLSYHGSPQIDHLSDLMALLCQKVFISSKSQTDYPHHSVITDHYSIHSPVNGILSAMDTHPDNAWLVVACDMPFIDQENLKHLISHRSDKNSMICYKNAEQLTEPLLSIWEPTAHHSLKSYHSSGKRSPREFLETHDATIITPLSFKVLANINTPEEYQNAKATE